MLAGICSTILLSGCGPKLGSSDYKASDVGSVSHVRFGRIVAARPVAINSSDPSKPGAGAAIGGLAGAGIGSTIGQGKGGMLGTVLGGLVGLTAGHFAEQGMTSASGFEYTIQLDSGNMISITQGDESPIPVDTTVKVIDSGGRGRSRIVPV